MTKENIYQRIEASGRLPELSREQREIFRLLDGEDIFDVDRVVRAVELDSGLRALFLRQAHVAIARDKLSVRDAVLYLGAESARNMLIYFIFRFFYAAYRDPRKKRFEIRQHWLHVLGTSVAAAEIADLLDYRDTFKLFTYGLLHDVGILVMDNCLPEELDRIYEMCAAGMHQMIAERTVMAGLTHGDVGGWLCRRWGLPEDISEIVQHHHTPHRSPIRSVELDILYEGDMIAMTHYHILLGMNRRTQTGDPRTARSLGITVEQADAIGRRLPQKVGEIREHFMIQP